MDADRRGRGEEGAGRGRAVGGERRAPAPLRITGAARRRPHEIGTRIPETQPRPGRGWSGVGAGRGGAWAAVPPRPEECGLWLVPCPHSGQRRNVNRVFTARPERICSVPSRQRTPGSGSRSDALSATPQSPQHLWVDGKEVRAVRSEGTQGQHPGRGALRTKCSLEKEGTQK